MLTKAHTHTATVMHPETYELLSPMEADEVSREESMEVTWEPGRDGEIEIEILEDGQNCLRYAYAQATEDDESHEVEAGELEVSTGEYAPVDGRCPARLRLTRTNEGQKPEGLNAGSTVRAHVIREVRFISVE